MFDFLLKNQPEFLQKFREYSKEEDAFHQAVENYIKEEKITMNPFSERLESTYYFEKTFNGDDFEINFSDNSNFILAKNKKAEEDQTHKAHIFIYSDTGSTKMNCHINSYDKNSYPIDFILEGVGVVEHFFLNEENLKIHELKFGTWQFSTDAEDRPQDKILNLFPATLREDEPSIEIKFTQEDENTLIKIQYNCDKFPEDKFNISFYIDKKKSNLVIFAQKDSEGLKSYAMKNIGEAIQALVNDSVSEYLSQEIDLKKLLFKADSDEIEIDYEFLPEIHDIKMHLEQPEFSFRKASQDQTHAILHQIHPTEKELQKLEESGRVGSAIATRLAEIKDKNPNQKIKNPQVQNTKKETSWIRL
jgi:hypothetical protein